MSKRERAWPYFTLIFVGCVLLFCLVMLQFAPKSKLVLFQTQEFWVWAHRDSTFDFRIKRALVLEVPTWDLYGVQVGR
jgi:hypothetical protein